MPLGSVSVLLEAAQRWLDLAPGEFVTAPCKRIAINSAAKRSRTTQLQIYSVKVCPKGEGGPRFRGGLVALCVIHLSLVDSALAFPIGLAVGTTSFVVQLW